MWRHRVDRQHADVDAGASAKVHTQRFSKIPCAFQSKAPPRRLSSNRSNTVSANPTLLAGTLSLFDAVSFWFIPLECSRTCFANSC